ncbi:alkaline phosphatase family protein [Curtobacterium sp. SP.BCo]|uniref:alkaline phosphatase family protein n=1 Tax=Curtobacterium sp. SP.BCo TaxID=3435229 RepID=UPI003F74023C
MPTEPPTPDDRPTPSRRTFLRRAGIGAAGAAVGAAAVGTAAAAHQRRQDERYGFTPLPERAEPGFDHLVVVMFENRSFDHVLGRLYQDDELGAGQSFEGLQHGRHANTAPDGTVVEAHVYQGSTDTVMSQPDPDPGEFYPHVNTQWFGVVEPEANATPTEHGYSAPYNAPRDTAAPTMSGFVHDYVVNFRIERGREPTADEYARVMGGFSPEMLPVFSTLAKSFAVYDHWHCAVPSQTFCNRSFFHASTSHGFVTNALGGGPGKWLDAPAVPTVFNRLEEAGKTWRVYFDVDQVVSLTGFLHAPSLERYWKSNFRSMEQFREDAANGTLPDYAFVEPRMVFDHNDMHPPMSRPTVVDVPGEEPYDSAMSDVRAAEALLAEVYAAVRGGRSTDGSNAINTALVVTFDEHGGLYDHVPPPGATPPSGEPEPGEMDFTFDRLGGRVPAFVVSAYTEPGTVVNDPMHHAAIVHTLAEQHGLEPLTHRDAGAASIRNVLNRTVPRQPQLWPDVPRPYVPANPEATRRALTDRDRRRPLTAPGRGLLGLLLAKYEPDAPVPETFGDAYDVLTRHGLGLFGDRD